MATEELGTSLLVKICVDRLAGDCGHTIAKAMADAPLKGVHAVEVYDKNRRPKIAKLEIR